MKPPFTVFAEILQTPGALTLNADHVAKWSPDRVTWKQLTSGHLVVYGPLGRRILLTDPDGHPLHECEWEERGDGTVHLVSARVFLDWGQWVGIKPDGLIHAMNLDLSTRPGWQTLTRQDLRLMAAQAMGVAVKEVEFFYTDDDLLLGPTGQAVIRQRKDALYVLENGTWERARFMSCMSAMHWARIDYLPVVELFQSLLPGTGSATFELIRGLYDDQNPHDPRPLRYRGIPTYPSEAAFGLFSNFFTATHPGTESPMAAFMDPPRSHQVEWRPHPHPPLRYVDPSHQLCLTVKHGTVRKVTRMDDASGLPFVAPNQHGFAPCGKRVVLRAGRLSLSDHKNDDDVAVQPHWGVTLPSPLEGESQGGRHTPRVGGIGLPSPLEGEGQGGRHTPRVGGMGLSSPLEGESQGGRHTPRVGGMEFPSPLEGEGQGGGTAPPPTAKTAQSEDRPSPITKSWEDVFPDGPPRVSPRDAYAAVLLYPEDETRIDELPSQPFIADFWEDLIERDQQLAWHVERAAHVLIHGFDAVIGTLLTLDRPRSATAQRFTIVYAAEAHAQKQAQTLWNRLVRGHRGERLEACRFVPEDANHHGAYESTYDLVYVWMPFASYRDHATLRDRLQRLSAALRPDGLALLAGPESVTALMSGLSLETILEESASQVRPFLMHRAILPRATLHPDLRIRILKKSS